MKITNKITNKVMKAATDAAAKVAVSNVNSACTFYVTSTKSTNTSKKIPKIISTHIESMKIMYSPLTNGVSGTSKELI